MAGIPPGSLLIGLSSIYWRESWKYGERAFRYVQLDAGHAIGAVRYAAAVLGWGATVSQWSDAQVASVLGLDRRDDFAKAAGFFQNIREELIGPLREAVQTIEDAALDFADE